MEILYQQSNQKENWSSPSPSGYALC
jgi:hypothetical protein